MSQPVSFLPLINDSILEYELDHPIIDLGLGQRVLQTLSFLELQFILIAYLRFLVLHSRLAGASA